MIAPAYTIPGTPVEIDEVSVPLRMGDTPMLEMELDEDAIAEQWFLRSMGMSTWLTRMPRRFPTIKVEVRPN